MHFGSQEDVQFLEKFKSNMSPFDIIIDDGGHTMNQQKTSFFNLISLVRSGGIYVIEDLETSYVKSYGGGYLKPSTTISFLKTFIDELQPSSPNKTIPIANKISSMEVGDSICFFTLKWNRKLCIVLRGQVLAVFISCWVNKKKLTHASILLPIFDLVVCLNNRK